MRPRVLVRTIPSFPGASDHVGGHRVVGGMRSCVPVIAVSMACLTFERHLVGDFERLAHRKDDLGRLVLYNNRSRRSVL